MIEFGEAGSDDTEVWDDLTVRPAGGHVLQSRSWADNRSRAGWQPHFLVGSDGSAVLLLLHPWPIVGGAAAYVSRGPIPNGTIDQLVARLEGVAAWAGDHGADILVADPEVASWGGYGERIRALGFEPCPEIQGSRERLVLRLDQRADEAAVFADTAKGLRELVLRTGRQGIAVSRYDASIERDDVGPDFVPRDDPPEAALLRIHGFMTGADRRIALLIPRAPFLLWTVAAFRARHLVVLEARGHDGEALAGVVLYQHGGRLSTAFAGEAPGMETRHPGVAALLRWRAIQLAARERCSELDLGSADPTGGAADLAAEARGRRRYEEARAFGAEPLELAGAHRLVIRRGRHRTGRLLARAMRGETEPWAGSRAEIPDLALPSTSRAANA